MRRYTLCHVVGEDRLSIRLCKVQYGSMSLQRIRLKSRLFSSQPKKQCVRTQDSHVADLDSAMLGIDMGRVTLPSPWSWEALTAKVARRGPFAGEGGFIRIYSGTAYRCTEHDSCVLCAHLRSTWPLYRRLRASRRTVVYCYMMSVAGRIERQRLRERSLTSSPAVKIRQAERRHHAARFSFIPEPCMVGMVCEQNPALLSMGYSTTVPLLHLPG